MAYSLDVKAAARRNFAAAEYLNKAQAGATFPHRAEAGYLYGIAAECAIKQIMRDSNMKPLASEHRKDDPFYAHFPELKTLLRDCCQGRRAQRLLGFATDSALLNEWDVTMRYAPAKDMNDKPISLWAEQAKNLVEQMDAV